MPAVLVNWSILQFQAFVLVLLRVSPILFMMPVLGSRNLPHLLKVGLALTVSLILLPTVRMDISLLPREPFHFGLFLVSEIMIGFILALAVKVIFAGIQMGGELMGFEMGFYMANVVDPSSEINTPLISQFLNLTGILLFLSIDGHHWFFRAVSQSFLLLVPGEIQVSPGLFRHFLNLTGTMFIIAVKIAAPVVAVLFFTQIAMGILAKAVPQVNILITSFPLTIGIGLLFLAFSVEIVFSYCQGLLQEVGRSLVSTLLPLMQR